MNDIECVMKNNNNIIFKSNELIESSYNLTTAQNRLIFLAMTKLENIILDKNLNIKDVEDRIKSASFDTIFISVIDYKKNFNIKGNGVYNDLVKIAEDLYEENVLYVKENGDYGKKRWVITCEYSKDQRGVKLQFHPSMIKDLLIFKSNYTGMLFDSFATKIKGKYSFRIYELCKQYLKIGRRDFFIDDLRFNLCLLDNEYSKYADLKRMISSAIKEISKCTDINIEFEELERNRTTKKVTKVRFIIRNNKENQIDMFSDIEVSTNDSSQSQIEKISKLINYQVTSQQARIILNIALTIIETNELDVGVRDYITEKVSICRQYMLGKKNINYIGLLIKALKGNWKENLIDGEVIQDIKTTKFNNFDPRDKDYDELERQLSNRFE